METMIAAGFELSAEEYYADGTSTFYCTECRNCLSVDDAQDLDDEREGECYHCNAFLARNSIGVTTLERDAALLSDVEKVKDRVWFHASFQENWLSEVITAQVPFVHVGSRQAAIDRAKTECVDSSGYGVFELYEVRITPSAVIGSPEEDNDAWDFLTDEERFTADAAPYLNRHEEPGSVSLAIRPEMLELVAFETLTDEEFSY